MSFRPKMQEVIGIISGRTGENTSLKWRVSGGCFFFEFGENVRIVKNFDADDGRGLQMPSFFLTKSNRVTKKAALSKEIEIIA